MSTIPEEELAEVVTDAPPPYPDNEVQDDGTDDDE